MSKTARPGCTFERCRTGWPVVLTSPFWQLCGEHAVELAQMERRQEWEKAAYKLAGGRKKFEAMRPRIEEFSRKLFPA